MIQAIQRSLAAAMVAGALLLTGGCATNYSSDLTPELASYGKSEQQDANTYARVIDNNTRTIWDDFARFFFLDKNSRLNPAVVP